LKEKIPLLRRDLRIEEAAGDEKFPFRVMDGRLGQKIKLDRRGAFILETLKDSATFEEFKKKISEADGREIEEERLRKIIDAFERLKFFETDGNESFASSLESAYKGFDDNPETISLHFLPGAGFSCTMCGGCCAGHNIGPVEDDVFDACMGARFDELKRITGSKKGLFFKMCPDGEKEDITVCHSRNGACVFLDDDRLCHLHKLYGEDQKPLVCRIFPFHLTMTPAGIYVGFQMECRNFLESSKGGDLRGMEGYVRTLLKKYPPVPVIRPVIMLDEGRELDFDEYLRIEGNILEIHEDVGIPAWDAVNRVSNLLFEKSGREPRRFADEEEAAEFFSRLIEDIYTVMIELRAELANSDEDILFHTETLDECAEALMNISSFVGKVFSHEDNPETGRLFRLYARNFWFSKSAVNYRTLLTGQAFFAFEWFLVRATAHHLARKLRRNVVFPRDIVDAMVAVDMLMRNKRLRENIRDFTGRIETLFAGNLSAVISLKDKLTRVEERLEFFLF